MFHAVVHSQLRSAKCVTTSPTHIFSTNTNIPPPAKVSFPTSPTHIFSTNTNIPPQAKVSFPTSPTYIFSTKTNISPTVNNPIINNSRELTTLGSFTLILYLYLLVYSVHFCYYRYKS